jgi:hypothetical protein
LLSGELLTASTLHGPAGDQSDRQQHAANQLEQPGEAVERWRLSSLEYLHIRKAEQRGGAELQQRERRP